MKLVKSSTSPIFTLDTLINKFVFNSGHRLLGIYARDDAEHFCPWYSKLPSNNPLDNSSTLAEVWAII